MTAVAPDGSIKNIPKKNKNKNALHKSSIMVQSEVGPGHMVTFNISKEFLTRTFGDANGESQDKKVSLEQRIQEIFHILLMTSYKHARIRHVRHAAAWALEPCIH